MKRLIPLAVFLFILSVAAPVSAQDDAVCWVYQVDVTGYVRYGNVAKNFRQSGYLGVTNVGFDASANTGDLSIILGTPVTNPSVGALSFSSNGYYIGGLNSTYRTGALDLADVVIRSFQDNKVVYRATVPTSNYTSNFGIDQGSMGNVLNWGSSFLSSGAKLVVGGYASAEFSQSTNVSGEIELRARDWTAYQSDVYYYGELSGRLVRVAPTVDGCVITTR